jgi:membrane protein implicated in regulation of membrane protease activity
MFGDALALWFITVGIVMVLAVAALIFMISWRLTARREKPSGEKSEPTARE